MTTTCFLEPLDVLFLRGNKLFGEPGGYGEALLPPWPSVAAGAIRSRLLVDEGIDLGEFSRSEVEHLALGTPERPGLFRLADFALARKTHDGIESLRPLPADLVVTESHNGAYTVRQLLPGVPAGGLGGSFPLPQWPLLAADCQAKPARGLWLGEAGWRRYLTGEIPAGDDLVPSKKLWSFDLRVGVGLDPARRRAEDGKLFSVQAVAFCEGVGFLAATEGDGLKADTLLRFGGDGRAARCRPVDAYQPPEPDLAAVAESGRARIVLTTPGIFPAGWRLPGMAEDGRFELGDVKGRVVAAAVNRAEVISGWDLAKRRPKAARRAAPTGSVYWLEDLEADEASLRKLVKRGLWPENDYDKTRQVEGFNRFTFAAY